MLGGSGRPPGPLLASLGLLQALVPHMAGEQGAGNSCLWLRRWDLKQTDLVEKRTGLPGGTSGPLQLSSVPLRHPLGLTYLKVQ